MKGDEFWKYTKPGNFYDYFKMEYIDNPILSIKTCDFKNTSEEINIDISDNEEKFFDNSFGKFKISISNEINPFTISSKWNCNTLVKEISNIVKKKIYYG